ncbi:MAG: UDP-glucose 4-epimerase [Bacteroidia bacterium]|jgi:UDP-glucose 4-epimerase
MILVTGGTGYIGSHTVVELLGIGEDVLIVDDFSNSSIEVLDRIEAIGGKRPAFVELDLVDKVGLEAVFQSHPNIKGVIHFAAKKAVGESVEKPLMYYRTNLVSLINLLDVMHANDVKDLVFSSSCSVYGEPVHTQVTEQTPIKVANSPYGNTKQICEEIITDTAHVTDLKAICLRYFNPTGAHDSANIGELPIGVPSNLIPFITQTGIGLREELTVYGGDYDTIDGTCIRDYIHVVDLAQAHLKALGHLANNCSNGSVDIINIGTGNGSTVLEVVNTFKEISGVELNFKVGPRREGDVVAVYADATKAKEVLGWEAKLNLKDMLASAWKWEQKIRNS